jgi:hypothetical protein
LSIWNIMMVGKRPFFLDDGQLCLKFSPRLPGWLFSEEGQLTFKFLGRCQVIYHNPGRLDIFGDKPRPQKIVLHKGVGNTVEIQASTINAPYAEEVRAGHITSIDVFFEKLR